MKFTQCPICSSSELKQVIPGAKDHITSENFDILGCNICNVHFTDPAPENMDQYYPSRYRRYGPVVSTLLRFFYNSRVRKWAKFTGKPGKVLEIGCGTGLMLDAFRRKGWDVMGTERTEEMAAHARDNLGLNVISGEIASIPKGRAFDLIIMFNVLEHMNNPLSILKECAARLKHGGVLVINVPNFDSWQARFACNLWLHLDPPRHLFHFSPSSLAHTVGIAGLSVEDVKFSSFEHDPYGWVQSFINKIGGRHNLLTRYLMGIEKLNAQVILSLLLCFIMVVPAVILSIISWMVGRGALMQVTAIAPER